MSSEEEEELFGEESEEEERGEEHPPEPKKEIREPAKKKRKKPANKLLDKLRHDAEKETNRRRMAVAAAKQLASSDDTLPPRQGTKRAEQSTEKRRIRECLKEELQDPILIKDDDLETRAKQPQLCKIEREIWCKRTRYYPFGGRNDVHTFYSEPTQLCCIWCTEPINAVPIPLAHAYSRPLGVFYVSGQFCTFACMIAKARTQNLQPLSTLLMVNAYGIRQGNYCPAPPPELLKKFGGCMSTTAYRATITDPKIKTSLSRLPFIPFSAGIEEVEKIRTVIYEYGDEEKVRRVMNSRLMVSHPTVIENSVNHKMQVSKFSKLPTLEEQIAQSERKLRLQMKETGLDDAKKKRTLKDFMNIKKGGAVGN